MAPDKVRTPVPVLVKEMPDNTPEKVVDVLSPPTVKIGSPAATLVTAQDPAKDEIVSAKPFKFKVPFTVTTDES